MLRGMARVTTAGDVITMGVAVLIGLGAGAIAAAGLNGSVRICAECIIGAAVIGVIAWSAMGIVRRYRQLSRGKCPNPLCHGVVQPSELVDENEVVCPTCKKTWPKLRHMHFRATARG